MTIEQAEFISKLFKLYSKARKNDLFVRNIASEFKDEYIDSFIKNQKNTSDENAFYMDMHRSNSKLFTGYSVTSYCEVEELEKIIKGIDRIWP